MKFVQLKSVPQISLLSEATVTHLYIYCTSIWCLLPAGSPIL